MSKTNSRRKSPNVVRCKVIGVEIEIPVGFQVSAANAAANKAALAGFCLEAAANELVR